MQRKTVLVGRLPRSRLAEVSGNKLFFSGYQWEFQHILLSSRHEDPKEWIGHG